MHWRHYVVDTPGLNLSTHFLTRETFLDMVTSCHHCILRFPQFRDNWGGKFKPDGPRFSSAYSEYFFQYGRMAQCNSPVVSVYGWFTHLKHYLYQQFLEATSTISLPASCRGIPHSIERVQIPAVQADWHPTDAQLLVGIQRGVQKAIELLKSCGIQTNLTIRNGFFRHPCKHFPLADSYVMGGQYNQTPGVANKEDDPTAPDADTSEVSAQDAADAQALFNQLLQVAAQPRAVPGAGAATAMPPVLLDEISSLITSFNQSIQEESKDRKYRFVVKRLMKTNQRAGNTLDNELDFYRDDDDVAVLFTLGGKKVWCIGNVEEVAVVRGNVDETQALSGERGAYLANLDKDYKPGGVFVDDPKGAFIFRWYREVDASGHMLTGYQNKNCKGYKLTLNNDGEPFYWVGNVQLISKVYLKKHPSQARTYTLNNKDKHMVNAKKKALS